MGFCSISGCFKSSQGLLKVQKEAHFSRDSKKQHFGFYMLKNLFHGVAGCLCLGVKIGRRIYL